MWCIRGEYVPIQQSIARVDGNWSDWDSEYTSCSRSCGGGIQMKRRYCNNPSPHYGGKECKGLSTKEKICNIEECVSDYRQEQCSKLHTANFLDGLVPALGEIGDPSCMINCPSDNGRVITNKHYLDGTECMLKESEPYSRCVNGKCQKFGCDWLSNSGLKYDQCGVCNGSGSSCRKMTDKYDQNGPTDSYTNVTTIPAGSSGILIHQTNIYCLLSMLVDGQRILNDGMKKSGSAVFNLYGIQFRYINDRTGTGETIEIVEKIEKDIVLQVLRFYDYKKYRGVTPNITYTYHVPNSQSFQAYAWAELPNQSCSRSCGSGVTSKTVRCLSLKGDFVEDYHCGLNTKPRGNIYKMQYKTMSTNVSEWGSCSVECGDGTKVRTIDCVSMVDGVDQVIPTSRCDALAKPNNSSRCVHLCSWRKGAWSECTRSCGEGYRTRKVSCVRYTGVDVEINATLCNANDKPEDTVRCRNGPCYVLDGTCVDKSADCRKFYDYDRKACDGDYRNWMLTNCSKTCGVCDNGSCGDEDICKRVDPSVDACNNPVYKVWMHAHCPKSCNICRDCEDCSKYDRKYCTRGDYVGYMKKNCPRYCNLC